MTLETRKHLSMAAVLASVVCAVFLVASAFAAASAAHQSSAQNWQQAEISTPVSSLE